jgi:hypothetical protein
LALQSFLGPRIKVFIDRRHDKKVLAQMMKTTFFKYGFLTVKYHQNAVKFYFLEEKDSKNIEEKTGGKL